MEDRIRLEKASDVTNLRIDYLEKKIESLEKNIDLLENKYSELKDSYKELAGEFKPIKIMVYAVFVTILTALAGGMAKLLIK